MPYTIEQELELEKDMVTRGADRYLASIRKAQEKGREHETQYGMKLMREFVLPLSDKIIDFCCDTRAVHHGAARTLVRQVLPTQAALITLTRLFSKTTATTKATAVCAAIGANIQDEARFRQFRAQRTESFDKVVADIKKRGSKDPRYVHRVLTHMANEFRDGWEPWSVSQMVKVGAALASLVVENFGLFEVKTIIRGGRPQAMLSPTKEAIDWIVQSVEAGRLVRPDRSPCIIPPDNWTKYEEGGYWHAQMRDTVKLVKVHSIEHGKFFKNRKMPIVLDAVNTLQGTAWRVNKPVHDVLLKVWENNLRVGLPQSEPMVPPPCPFDRKVDTKTLPDPEKEIFQRWKAEAHAIYNLERERRSKCVQLVSVMRTAGAYRQYDQFYFPMQADFRGRLYSVVPGFSPQGPNFGKGLIEFAEGKPLGKGGAFHFLAHGAGLLGYDKVSYQDRVQYILAQSNRLKRAADDPLSYRDVWAEADKPWQFLAWLFEFRKYLDEGESLVSHLPIGLDGSCNGLQHFSAMLRDSVGGAATNLVPADKPNDIYARVAERVHAKLLAMKDDPKALEWLSFGIDRKLVKPPVMTLPYGSTRRTCSYSLYDRIRTVGTHDFEQAFTAAVWLTPLVWDSIGEVVVAARHAMGWLRDSANVLAKAGHHIEWVTPSGFPMFQKNTKTRDLHITTVLGNNLKLRAKGVTPVVDPRTQQSGCSPNFVHSMDATHLCMTANAAAQQGVTSFAMIHDDFGTHAADTETLHHVLREQFVKLYRENDVLSQFKEQNEERTGVTLPDLPAMGTLDINDVQNSPYFFG